MRRKARGATRGWVWNRMRLTTAPLLAHGGNVVREAAGVGGSALPKSKAPSWLPADSWQIWAKSAVMTGCRLIGRMGAQEGRRD